MTKEEFQNFIKEGKEMFNENNPDSFPTYMNDLLENAKEVKQFDPMLSYLMEKTLESIIGLGDYVSNHSGEIK